MEQPAELKGVFGEGKSVVAVAPSSPPNPISSPSAGENTAHGLFKAPAANDARSALVARPDRSQAGPVTDEAQRRLIELRAQSRGLWSDSSDKLPAAVTQPRVERLPKAVLGVTSLTPPANTTRAVSMPPPAASMDSARSARPEKAIDSDAPTSPPPDVLETSADSAWVSDRPTDVRKSLRALSMQPSRPSEEPTPEVDRRSTPLVARPDEPFAPQAAPSALANTPSAPELTASELAQAVQHGALESARRSGMRRALVVLIVCVVLLGLGLLLGLWPTPWSRSGTRTGAGAGTQELKAPPANAPSVTAPALKEPTAQPQPTAAPTPPQPTAAPTPPQPTAAATPPQPTAAAPQPLPTVEPDAPGPGAQAGPTGPMSVGDGLRAARGYLRTKDPAAAESVLRPLVEQNPEDHHIAELLVQALIDQRRGSEAAALAQRIIKKRPKRAVYRVLLGDALRVSGALTAANAAWREALELEPDNKEAHKRLNQP